MPIQVLPGEVALKIAAGEVITRPADAAKELVENAIDACLVEGDRAAAKRPGPRRVDVEIREGGLSLIRVVDSGCGIPAAEAPLAFERHATSKLSTVDDLFAVRTLGFRGEALASIAAISQVALYTRTPDAALGTFLSLDAGRVVEQGLRAGPAGTSLTVRNLFQNVPARLRFLRTATGEAGRILQVVGQYAVAFPEIRFSLLNDGRLVLQSSGSGRLEDALATVHDAALVAKLLPVEHEAGRLRLTGYVSEPGTLRATRAGISIFVNRRLVQSRALTYALEEAYQPALPAGRHPFAVLLIELPPDEVDVNVHPTKAEVRFVDERAIYSAVRRAVRSVVLVSAPVPSVGASLVPAGAPEPGHTAEVAFPVEAPPTQPMLPVSPGSGATPHAEPPAEVPPATAGRTGLPILHPVGQVHRTYIVAEGPDGVYFVDQHTAHERIRYEEIQAQRAANGIASQVLLEPVVVSLTARQWELLGEGAPAVRSVGFDFEPLGDRACLLRAIPAIVRRHEPGAAFGDVLDALAQEGPVEGVDPLSAVLACHSAVRAGDSLTPEEIRGLLQRLEGLDVWRYCPHGRPIVIRLDATQLARDFHRL